MANARAKAEQADQAAMKAEQDSDTARLKAKQFAPEFHQPGTTCGLLAPLLLFVPLFDITLHCDQPTWPLKVGRSAKLLREFY